MHKKAKVNKAELPSFTIFSRTHRKLHNRSVDISESNKSYKIKKSNRFPLLLNIDQGFHSHLLHSLRESLTVKKIQFSPVKSYVNSHISVEGVCRNKYQPHILERVLSIKGLGKHRGRAKMLIEKMNLKKIKHGDKIEKIEKIEKITKNDKPESAHVAPKKNINARKEYVAPRIPTYTPPPIKIMKPLPRMPFKEAIRNPI